VTTITVRHRPADLLRLGLYTSLRSATLKWTLLAIAVAIFGINLYHQKFRFDPFSLFVTTLTTALFAAGAFVFFLATNLLSTLLKNRKRSPAAQTQAYSLTDAGLSRRSATSETLIKWGGARSLHKDRRAIYIRISATGYFILPRRFFTDDEEYRLFWNSIQKLTHGR
jgi:YcxB-like protein